MEKRRLLVFASGGKRENEGGSGFENLVTRGRQANLSYEVVGVVSHHRDGGVAHKAARLGVLFALMEKPFDGSHYEEMVRRFHPDIIALSGWLKYVVGLGSAITFNIHPGPTEKPFGGNGMYGDHVHEKVMEVYRAGDIKYSAVSMHFVTAKVDGGPVFFRRRVKIKPRFTAENLKTAVSKEERKWQPVITDLIACGKIHWDGKDPKTLVVPENIAHLTAEALY